jgi:hypothetical protein
MAPMMQASPTVIKTVVSTMTKVRLLPEFAAESGSETPLEPLELAAGVITVVLDVS